MNVYKNETYSADRGANGSTALVTRVSGGKVHYQMVVSLASFGRPITENIHRTASLASFARQFPYHIPAYN